MLFDGDCGICRGLVDLLGRLDGWGRLDLVPLQAPGVLAELGISRQQAERALHVVTPDGEVHVAGDALRVILSELPWLWPAAWLWRLPGFGWLVERLYHLVGEHRYQLSGWLGLGAGCGLGALDRR